MRRNEEKLKLKEKDFLFMNASLPLLKIICKKEIEIIRLIFRNSSFEVSTMSRRKNFFFF